MALAQTVSVHAATGCLGDCATAAQSCVAVRQQERTRAAAACTGTKRLSSGGASGVQTPPG